MDLVRLCPVCEHINPSADAPRCRSCWAFLTDAATVSRAEAERRVGRVRIPAWRRRYVIAALAFALAFAVWRVVTAFDLVPLVFPPPGPKSDVSADAAPGNWAQVRGSANSAGYAPERAPVPQTVLWTFDAGEPLTNAPAVAGKQVFLSTEGGRTLSLDRDTGRVLWEYRSPFPASSTPAVTGDLAVTAFRPGKVVALDRASGNVRWETELGEPLFSSPVIAGGRVYIGATDRDLHGLDAATGERHWSYTSDDWVNAPVSYDGDILALASRATRVELVETRTARRKFVYDVAGTRKVAGGPVVRGDMAYFATQNGIVWAIDRNLSTYPWEGAIRFVRVNLYIWGLGSLPTHKGSVWTYSLDGETAHGPAVSPGAVFAATLGGKAVALDRITGDELWTVETGAEISSGLMAAGDTVLAGAKDGRVLALDAETGELRWEFQTGGGVTATPVAAGGVLYVVSGDGKLYAAAGR